MKYLCFLIAFLCACGDDSSSIDAADTSEDTSTDIRVGDAPEDTSVDTSEDTSVDPSGDTIPDAPMDALADANTSDGGPQGTSLEAALGNTREVLNVAYFGLNSSDGTIYLEAYGNPPEGCPSQNSETPERTLILGSLPMLAEGEEVEITSVFFDFESTLTMEPFVRSREARATGGVTMASQDSSGVVRLRFEGAFPVGAEEITISGEIEATYCASLDG